MKLRLLVFIGLLTSLFVSAQAQTSSNDVASWMRRVRLFRMVQRWS